MYCARCRKVIARHEPRIWAVLPGRDILVPTCYDDRLCEIHKIPIVVIPPIIKPIVVLISQRPVFIRIRNKIRGWAKYRRKYKFYGSVRG